MLSGDYVPFHTLAAAYGASDYGASEYSNAGQQATGGVSAPGAPDTGFFAQPSYVVLPSLLAAGIMLGTVSFLISKKLRRR